MRNNLKSWLIVGLLLSTAAYCLAEELTLTTYYPSPRGVYQELRSTSASYFATNQGNVGIGTDTPQARLEVGKANLGEASIGEIALSRGNGALGARSWRMGVNDAWDFSLGDDGFGTGVNRAYTPYLTIRSAVAGAGATGNVGIGTTAPVAPLSIRGGTVQGDWGQLDIDNPSAGAPNSIRAAITLRRNGAQQWMIGNDTFVKGTNDFFIQDAVNGANRFYIGPNGNVGIGTVAPQTTLQVAGGVAVGQVNAAANTVPAGTLRWNLAGPRLEVSDGTSWGPAFGVPPPPPPPTSGPDPCKNVFCGHLMIPVPIGEQCGCVSMPPLP